MASHRRALADLTEGDTAAGGLAQRARLRRGVQVVGQGRRGSLKFALRLGDAGLGRRQLDSRGLPDRASLDEAVAPLVPHDRLQRPRAQTVGDEPHHRGVVEASGRRIVVGKQRAQRANVIRADALAQE